MKSNFDKYPSIEVSKNDNDCIVDWSNICHHLNQYILATNKKRVVVAIDCYQGVLHHEVEAALRRGLEYKTFFCSTEVFKTESEIKDMVYPDVTDDRVFGFMT